MYEYYYVVNSGVCVSCGICAGLCPENAFYDCGDFVVIDGMECTCCGECYGACPVEAIEQYRNTNPPDSPSLWDMSLWGISAAKWLGTSHDDMDCSRLVWTVYAENGLEYPESYWTGNFDSCPDFYQVTNPQTGDVVLFDGHMGIYEASPPVAGLNVYSSTNHGVRYGANSWFPGTPRYYRYRR